jgi:putative SOS response-associated peptidase YedK
MRRSEGLSRVSWKLSRTVLRGAVGGNADCLLDKKVNGKTGPKFDITVSGQSLFGFAGLSGNWTNPKTTQVEKTFSIFTTVPNERFAEYHNRQPVILDPSEFDEWLAPGERPPAHLLRIFPEEKMVITPVGPPAALADEGPLQVSLFG